MGDDIRMHLKAIRWEEKDWIYLAQNRDKWLAIVETLLNFGFHKTQGVS